jgi:NAD(P) transhydrogenase subunit alpha
MVFGAANVVGGYVVTDRMLQMFRRREPAKAPAETASAAPAGEGK